MLDEEDIDTSSVRGIAGCLSPVNERCSLGSSYKSIGVRARSPLQAVESRRDVENGMVFYHRHASEEFPLGGAVSREGQSGSEGQLSPSSSPIRLRMLRRHDRSRLRSRWRAWIVRLRTTSRSAARTVVQRDWFSRASQVL